MLAKSKQFWNPDKTQFWIDSGVPLVIDRREGYFIYDVEGKRLIDVHLNGGTYNLGHRNPEVAAAVTAAMQHFDIGNHHFPSDRKSTRLNSSHLGISYAVFCLKKKNNKKNQ